MTDNHLIDNRQIRVFISSTFQDMQEERQYLFNYTFPKLRMIAEKRDVRIVEIDLRWGITYEESANGKVMQICFEEIDKCRPFFIGILGDRYGWCPDTTELEKNPNTEKEFPWARKYIEEGKSMTEMEMQFGALCAELQPQQKIKASFYIKENSNNTDFEQIKLKEQVHINTNINSCYYRSKEDLGEKIEKEIIALLDEAFPLEQCEGFEKETISQRAALDTFSFGVHPKPNILRRLNQFIFSNSRYLVLHGDHGSGKTSTLAYWIKNEKAIQDYYILYYFVGESDVSTMESYQIYIRKYLKKLFKIEERDPINEYDFGRFTYHFTKIHKILFIIDGVDQFENSYIHPAEYLPYVGKESKVIVSSRTNNFLQTDCAHIIADDIALWEQPEVLNDTKYYLEFCKGMHGDNPLLSEYFKKVIEITALNKKNIKDISNTILIKYGKRLTNKQLQEIELDSKSRKSYMLRMLMNSVLYLSTPEELDQYIHVFCSADDINDFLRFLMNHYETLYGKELLKHYLLFILVSRNGLPETDLLSLLKTSQLSFSRLHCGITALIKNKSGYIRFANDTIIDFIKLYYKKAIFDTYRKRLVDYYLARNQYADAKPNPNSWLWKFDLPYQCKSLMQLDDLYQAVSYPEVLLAQFVGLSYGGTFKYWIGEISDYWKMLLTNPEKYSFDIYFNNPEKYLSYEPLSLAFVVGISDCLHELDKRIHYTYLAIESYTSYGEKYIPSILFLYMILAGYYQEANNTEWKKQILLKAFDLCKKYLDRDDFSGYFSNIITELAEIYGIIKRSDWSTQYVKPTKEGKKLYEEAYSCILPFSEKETYINLYLRILSALSWIYAKENKFDMALQRILAAIEVSEKHKNKIINGQFISEISIAFYHYECSTLLKKLDSYEEAEKHAMKAYNYYKNEKQKILVGNMLKLTEKLLLELKESS